MDVQGIEPLLSAFLPTFTRADMEAILTRVGYRPGWTFIITAIDSPDDPALQQVRQAKLCLKIDGPVVDAYDHSKTTRIGIRNAIPPHIGTEEQFMKWLTFCLQRIEIHEQREFLQLDGKPFDSPHS